MFNVSWLKLWLALANGTRPILEARPAEMSCFARFKLYDYEEVSHVIHHSFQPFLVKVWLALSSGTRLTSRPDQLRPAVLHVSNVLK